MCGEDVNDCRKERQGEDEGDGRAEGGSGSVEPRYRSRICSQWLAIIIARGIACKDSIKTVRKASKVDELNNTPRTEGIGGRSGSKRPKRNVERSRRLRSRTHFLAIVIARAVSGVFIISAMFTPLIVLQFPFPNSATQVSQGVVIHS